MTIACIVEGKGEVEAVPLLLRRIKGKIAPNLSLDLPPPLRVPKTKLQKREALQDAVRFASKRTGEDDAVLLLMDADDDCPAERAPELMQWAQAARPDRRISIVLAKREYEAWFLAAASSLKGKRGFEADPPSDPEAVRGAKEWMSARMEESYRATRHQPAFTAYMDLEEARAAATFDKLHREMQLLLQSSPTPT